MFDYAAIKRDMLGWLKPEPAPARDRELAAGIDRGDYEIYTHKLDAALDEAYTVFVRTAVSTMAKSGDLVVGLHNARGDAVTASCGTYIHAPIAQLPVKFLIDRYLDTDASLDIEPGDIFYANEALAGGLHNPDQMAIMPIFTEDEELIGWASAALHQAETGAIEQGGMPVRARTRYDEGMRLTPIKLAEDYEIRDDLMDMMVNFISRSPRTQEIDVRARCTAVDKLRERVLEVVEDRGVDFVRGLFQRMIERAESGARSRIASWNDGAYRSVGFFDTIGYEEGLVKLSLELRKDDDTLTFDFSGTSPEAGSYNMFAHGVASFMSSFLFPYVFSDLPVSTGVFEPFEYEVPEGSILNASPEASVANCVLTGRSIAGLCHNVFGRMLYATDPERVAASPGTTSGAGTYTGWNRYGVRESNMIAYTLNTDAQGARPDLDGMDTHGFFYAPWGKAPNVEDDEQPRMFRGLTRAYHRDTCGFGKRRGGSAAQNINIVVSGDPVEVLTYGKNTRIPQDIGLFGGYSSTALLGVSIEGTDVIERLAAGDDIPTDVRELVTDRPLDGEYRFERMNRATRELGRGDVFVNMSPGGGGFGDPLERDPEAVRDDVARGIISEWTASGVYGVELDDDGVDDAGTAARRDRIRAERLEAGEDFEAFRDEWRERRPPTEALTHYGEWPDAMRGDRAVPAGR